MNTFIRVDLAVNDHIGRRTRRIEAVTITGTDGDEAMVIEASLPFSINTVESRMTIAKRRFEFQGHRSHVGSVVYDAVNMKPEQVADLVNHLRDNGGQCTSATSELISKYDRHHRFSERDFLGL